MGQGNKDQDSSVDEILDDVKSDINEGNSKDAGGSDTDSGAEGLFDVSSSVESSDPDTAGDSEPKAASSSSPSEDKPEREKAETTKKRRAVPEAPDAEQIGPDEPTAPSPHLSAGAKAEQNDEPNREQSETDSSTDNGSPVGDVLSPSSSGGDSGDIGGSDISDPLLDEEDPLAEFDSTGGFNPSSTTLILTAVIIGLIGLLGFIGLQYTDVGDDLIALFQGNLKQKRMAEARQKEQEFKEKQLEKMTKYGNLKLNGTPKYALIKLNGEVQYGKPSGQDLWTELRLTPSTTFRNLEVGKEHKITVDAPNFEKKEYELTEGMWEEGASPFSFNKMLEVTLPPKNGKRQLEFDQRLKKDTSKNHFGEITIKTTPPGALVEFNNHPLVDEDGKKLKTPVTFDKYYVPKDEDSDQLEEKKVRVDTPLDRGHKIVLLPPGAKIKDKKKDKSEKKDEKKDDKNDKEEAKAKKVENTDTSKYVNDTEYVVYATNLQRRMWSCNWKDGEAPEASYYPKHCDYKFNMELNFKDLKDYIEKRKEKRAKIKEETKKAKKAMKKEKQKSQ